MLSCTRLSRLLVIVVILGCYVSPVEAELIPIESRVRLSYESIDMPAPDDRLGLIGFHYLVNINQNFYAGLGGYGAVAGDRGGFLTGGLTSGVQKSLTAQLSIDAGLFVGSGGGGSAPQGDGLMLRPYAGLVYDFSLFRLGASYSRVDFPKTDITSNHLALTFDLPFSSFISSGSNGSAESAYSTLSNDTGKVPGFIQQEIMVLVRAYSPSGSVVNTSGTPTDERISLIGAQFRHFLSPGAYVLIESLGAFDGNADGFAEILFGGGYRFPLSAGRKLRLNFNLAVGAGGGGKIDVGGGGLMQVEAGIEYRFTPAVFAALNGGYIDSFNGSFKATVIGAELGFTMENLSAGVGTKAGRPDDVLRWNDWRLRAAHLTYTAPDRKVAGLDSKPLQLIGAKIDYFLRRQFYLSGQGASAYSGDAGGYAVGLVGLGMQTNHLYDSGLSLFAEVLTGASGGGGIAVGDGAIWQPMVGLDYDLNDSFSLQMMSGMVQALSGDLVSPVFDLSICWKFAQLGRNVD